MTFLELCQRVRQESGISGSGPVSVLNQTSILQKVVEWVKQADLDVQKLPFDWAFMWGMQNVTLAKGVSEYTGASMGIPDLKEVRTIDINGYPLRKFSWAEFKINRRYMDQSEGMPSEFTIRPDGVVVIYPAPRVDTVSIIEFNVKSVTMLDDGDQSIIPEEHHDIILQKALMYYASHEEDNSLYSVANIRYENDLSILTSEYTPEITFTGGIR